MKKVLQSLVVALSLPILLLQLVSCGKEHAPTPPVITLPSEPKFSLSVSPAGKVLFDSTITIKIETTTPEAGVNQSISMDDIPITTKSPVVVSIKGERTFKFVVTNTNANGSKSASKSILAQSFTKKSSDLELLKTVKMSYCTGVKTGSTDTFSIDLDPDVYRFYADGKSARNGVVESNNLWRWSDSNETVILFGGGDPWQVELLPNGFKRTQEKNGYIAVQIYLRHQ